MLAGSFDRARAHSQPAIPWLLVPDTRPVPVDIADQLGQHLADRRSPQLRALEHTEYLPDAVHEGRPHVLLYQALSLAGFLGYCRGAEDTLPAGLATPLLEAGGQFHRRAQDADITTGEDRMDVGIDENPGSGRRTQRAGGKGINTAYIFTI
jgi:hypothetical protein